MLPLLKKFLVLAVPVFLPVAGCAMGPDYTRPDVPLPDSFRMAQPASDSSSIANVPWWELLHDRELQRLIRIALEENKDLKRAMAAVEEFQARALVARMDFAPQLGLAGNLPIARMGGVRFPGFPSQFAHYAEGTLSWELDLWGRIRRSNEAALGDLLAQEENRRAVILQLVSGVAQSYFDLRQLDMQLEIAIRTLKSWEESVGIAQVRLEEGVITKLDADQFEAQRANAAARTADLERQIVQKENELSVLLGRNPAAIPRGRSLLEQALPSEVPAGLPSELLQRRPDIVQVEQQLAAATARIGAAKAERFPKITLTGILGVASPQLSRMVNPEQFGEVGPALVGPLFNAQILGFQQRAVEAQARQVLAQYEQTILVAFREVEDALVAVRKTREQSHAQEEQVTALQSALDLANLRYQGGVASYLDVLIAQQSLFDAELSLTATRRLHLVSIVQLYRALGGGWVPDGMAQASPDPVRVRSGMLAAQ
jgi:outer membrane protein, multidrug efflux system